MKRFFFFLKREWEQSTEVSPRVPSWHSALPASLCRTRLAANRSTSQPGSVLYAQGTAQGYSFTLFVTQKEIITGAIKNSLWSLYLICRLAWFIHWYRFLVHFTLCHCWTMICVVWVCDAEVGAQGGTPGEIWLLFLRKSVTMARDTTPDVRAMPGSNVLDPGECPSSSSFMFMFSWYVLFPLFPPHSLK